MNIVIGCVILANTTNLEKYGMTQRTLQTLLWSEPDFFFNIIVVESNPNAQKYGFIYDQSTLSSYVKTIIPNESFGYNKFLNKGIAELKKLCENYEWNIITNNDVIFTQKWFTKLIKWQQDNPSVLSLSPWEPNWHMKKGLDPNHGPYFGYRTSYEITGWCLVINNSVIEKCNLFDPRFEFWYQDNDYALTLEQSNIKHALVPQSRVYHMVSGTHDIINKSDFYKMTDGQLEILKQKWPNLM